MRMYSAEYKGYFPPLDDAAGLEMLRSLGYCENSKIYTCPSTDDYSQKYDDKPLIESKFSYRYFGGYTETDPEDTIVMCDKTNNHRGYRNILLLDGTSGGYSNGIFKAYDIDKGFVRSDKKLTEKELKKLKE